MRQGMRGKSHVKSQARIIDQVFDREARESRRGQSITGLL